MPSGLERCQWTGCVGEDVLEVRQHLREGLRTGRLGRRACATEPRADPDLGAAQPMPEPVSARDRHRARRCGTPRCPPTRARDHSPHEYVEGRGARHEPGDHVGPQDRERTPASWAPVPIRAEETTTAHDTTAAPLGVAVHDPVANESAGAPASRARPQLCLLERIAQAGLVGEPRRRVHPGGTAYRRRRRVAKIRRRSARLRATSDRAATRANYDGTAAFNTWSSVTRRFECTWAPA